MTAVQTVAGGGEPEEQVGLKRFNTDTLSFHMLVLNSEICKKINVVQNNPVIATYPENEVFQFII